MLPVSPCSFGLLCSVRSVAALTWISGLLLIPLVSCAHDDHDDAALAALNSSVYPAGHHADRSRGPMDVAASLRMP